LRVVGSRRSRYSPALVGLQARIWKSRWPVQEEQIQLLVTLSSPNAPKLCKFYKQLVRANPALHAIPIGLLVELNALLSSNYRNKFLIANLHHPLFGSILGNSTPPFPQGFPQWNKQSALYS
jgi:hypothetical protein